MLILLLPSELCATVIDPDVLPFAAGNCFVSQPVLAL